MPFQGVRGRVAHPDSAEALSSCAAKASAGGTPELVLKQSAICPQRPVYLLRTGRLPVPPNFRRLRPRSGGDLATFSRIMCALTRRRAAAREAETLVSVFGARGVEMACTRAEDPSISATRRAHCRRVAHIAERRHQALTALVTASRYAERARWRAPAGRCSHRRTGVCM
jgi:hypothetical protein